MPGDLSGDDHPAPRDKHRSARNLHVALPGPAAEALSSWDPGPRSARGSHFSPLLLCHLCSQRMATLHRDQVVASIKRQAAQLGFRTADYSGHSLRWGGRTSAAAAKLSVAAMQQLDDLAALHSLAGGRFGRVQTSRLARFPTVAVNPI